MKHECKKWISVVLALSLIAAPIEQIGLGFCEAAYAMTQPASGGFQIRSASASDASRDESRVESEKSNDEIEEEDDWEDEDEIVLATDSDAESSEKTEKNPFGLADEDLPASYEELFGFEENMALSLADESEAEDTSTVSVKSNVVTSGDFVIRYTSVSMEQKKFTITSDMKTTVNLLTTPHTVAFEDGTYQGFRVVSLMFEVTEAGQDDSDEEHTLVFYADEIVSGSCYVNVRMELGGGNRFAEGLYYTKDVNDESGTWTAYSDATYTSGRYMIKVRHPYGAFVAKPEDTAKTEGNSKALILVQTEDESLGTGPEEDAEALCSALTRTGEFSDENVTVMEIPQDTDEDYKTKIWNWIDEAAKEERLTLIAYTGHGDYHDDGTSELSLGGSEKQNTIQAVELKQHIAKLSGKVVLVLDCCFSGGMIMPTMDLEDDGDSLDVDATMQQAQDQADQYLKTFVKDFKKTGADSSALSYYIYAAASAYETSIQNVTGGQLITAFCHALGYDRNDASYNIYAADVNADYEVSAGELADHIKRSCTQATPSIYPSKGTETLFTYAEDNGTPAVFSMTIVDDDQNILVQSDNSIQVKVKVKNYSNKAITFDAMMGMAKSAVMDVPGTWEDVARYSSENLIYHEDINRHELAAGAEKTFTLTFQADKEDAVWLKQGGRCLVRIWGCKDTDASCYAISDFYIGSAKIADDPDPDAFELKKPAYVYSAAEAIEVSSIVPVNVAFDQEPVDKQGYAACTLTARAVDLGETDGSQTESDRGYYAEDGKLMLNGTEVSDDGFADQWIEIYANVRPVYTRKDLLGDPKQDPVTGSCYSYEWDVTGLKKDHFYLVQILCDYDSNEDQRKTFTFVKVVDPSADLTHVISEQNLRMYELASYSGGGIALKGDWTEKKRTVKETTSRLENYWNTYSYLYDGTNKDIKYTIATDESSGWYECLADGSVREMKETETFQSGKDYANRLIMTINANYNAVFANWANVQVAGHSLATDYDDLSRNLSDDKKTLTVYILHKNVTVDDSGFHVYLAGTKTPVTEKTKLEVGTEIDVYATDGWSIYTYDDSGLESVSGEFDGFERFRVQPDQTKISLLLYHKLKYTTGDDRDCACASLLFEHEVTNRSSEIGTVSLPKKTFYAVGSKELDLSGSEVVLYDADRKAKTTALTGFLSQYKTKLYTSLDGETYAEWTNENLNQLGAWELFLKYNGAYYPAFTIQVGYEQGESFKLNGSLTYNRQGEANYVSDEDSANAVLFVTSSFEATDEKTGIITCEHDLRFKTDSVSPENYQNLYPADGAKISYLLPYPDLEYPPLGGKAYDYKVVDANANVPVSLEKRADGLWVTTTRNGEFQVQYSLEIGGNDGGTTVPDNDSDKTQPDHGNDKNSSSRSGGHSSEASVSAVRTYGDWIPEVTASMQKIYRFRMTNGEYATGWRWIFWQGTERWFYFGTDGIMRTGWLLDGDKWYYLRTDGDMAVGWIFDQGIWYYLGSDGSMKTGWIFDAGTWYYLQPDGRLADNTERTKTA